MFQIAAWHIAVEAYGGSHVSGVVKADNIQSYKLFHQIGKQHGAVFAVGIRIIEHLVREEELLMAKLLVISLIRERLHKLEQELRSIDSVHAADDRH